MIIGIDFGTTKTVAARYDNHRTEVITDRRGRRSLPSLVLVTPEKNLFVGWEASTHTQRYQSEHISITSIKRSLGRQGETGWGWWKTHPQEVAALILARLKLEIEAQHNSEITGAVIAIPAHFDINQRWAVAQAAEIAGIKVLRLLNEATAVALNYCMTRVIPDSKILVFDFGGGTLDVSVLEVGQGLCEVKAIAGDGDLGGDDFDQVILNHVLEEAKAQIGRSSDLNTTELLVLKEAVTRAKAELSSAQSTQIYVPGLFRDSNRNHRPLDLTITRDTFNNLSKGLLRRTEEVIQKALTDASIKRDSDLNGVLMIGGTTRIPAVRELLRKKIGLSPHVGVDPETCVAEGAAIQAAVLTGNLQKMLLLDGLPRSLSIGTAGGVTKLIPRNTTFPTRKSEEFSTTQDNQTQIEVNIFEGESDVAKENAYVGRIVLSNIPPAPKGIPKIEVIFDIDGSGTLHATARDIGTGRKTEAVISAPYRLNAAQIKVIGRKVEQALSQTKLTITREVEKDQDMMVRNAALECERKIGQFLDANQNDLSALEAQVLISGRQLIIEFIDREAPREDVKQLIEGLNLELDNALATLVCESLVTICDGDDFESWVAETHKGIQEGCDSRTLIQGLNASRAKDLKNIFARITESSHKARLRDRVRVLVNEQPRPLHLFAALWSAHSASEGPVFESTTRPIVDLADRTLLLLFALTEVRRDQPQRRRIAAAHILTKAATNDTAPVILNLLSEEPDPLLADVFSQHAQNLPGDIFVKYFVRSEERVQDRWLSSSSLRPLFSKTLLEGLQLRESTDRRCILNAICRRDDSEALVETLALIEGFDSDEIRGGLISSLTRFHDQRTIQPLIGWLLRGNAAIRQAADETLAHAGELLDADIGRFLKLVRARNSAGSNRSLSVTDRYFLSRFVSRHREYEELVAILRTKGHHQDARA